jgi:hypothetical protein
MLKTAAALSAIVAVSSVGAALAQEAEPGISGTIQSIDEGSRTIVLDDGKTYMLNADQHVSTLREGSRVNLSCDDAMTNCLVSESGTTGESGPTGQSDTPESSTQPSAGTESGGVTGSDQVPPGNTAPEATGGSGGSEGTGDSGGNSGGGGESSGN